MVAGIVFGVLGLAATIYFGLRTLRKPATERPAPSTEEDHPQAEDMPLPVGIPPRNPNFTGREDLLAMLRATLCMEGQAAVTQAITGLGGVGKTQTALEYAHRNIDNYELIAWIRAEAPGALLADLANLARALGIGGVDRMSPEDLTRAIHRSLAKRGNWLVVFDNAEGPSMLRPYLPPLGNGHSLITSREQNWRSLCAPLDVSPFAREESIEFLLKRSGDDDREGAGAVAQALGDLPLALEQAGAYVESTGTPLSRYAEQFAERHEDLWRDQAPPDDYHGTVTTSWSLALDALAEESPVSVQLMKLVSFLAADDIPLSLLKEGAEALNGSLQEVASDDVALSKALGALRSQSLINRAADSLSIHPLVQVVVRDAMEHGERDRWTETSTKLLRAAYDFREDDPRTWRKCRRLVPHVAAAADHAEKRSLALEETSYLLGAAGLCLGFFCSFELAREYCERAIRS